MSNGKLIIFENYNFAMNLCTPEAFCPGKTYCVPMYFNIGVSFELKRNFLFVLHTNSCHCPNEIATVGIFGNELLSALFDLVVDNVAMCGGTSVIDFLNTHYSCYFELQIINSGRIV